jgi:hypothetical protein
MRSLPIRHGGIFWCAAVLLLATACSCGGKEPDEGSEGKAVQSLIEQYYFLVRNGRFEEIPELRSSMAAGDERAVSIVENMEEVCGKLGSLESFEPVLLLRSEGVYLATYSVEYANGGTKEEFTVEKDGNEFKISNFNMHSIRFDR